MHEQMELFERVTFDRIYIPKEYVQDGSKDVGIARMEGHRRAENTPNHSQWLQRSVGGGELVGKTVVGHGRIFLRGSVLSYPVDNGRLLISAPSISGCSGCPLIDGDKKLTAFVHGGVKHRGGRVLHNHDGVTDNVTSYLYADSIVEGSTFLRVDPKFYESLRTAEDIEDELASKPANKRAYKKHASEELRKIAPGASTLEESMEALSSQIWPGDIGEGDKITIGPQLELLSHHS